MVREETVPTRSAASSHGGLVANMVIDMKEETKSKLDAVFKAEQVAKGKQEAFLQNFMEAQDTIIRPAMEEIGEYVRGKGYSHEISTEEDGISNDGNNRPISASTRITFFLGERQYPRHQFPGFSVICDKNQELVFFHESTMSPGRGGHAGGAGQATLPEVTKDLIQEKISNVLSEVFR